MPIYEFRCKKCKKEFECLVFGKGGASHVCNELQERRQIRLFILIGLCDLWGGLLQHLPLIPRVRSEESNTLDSSGISLSPFLSDVRSC
jgi:putative FmdB family regulatory protein